MSNICSRCGEQLKSQISTIQGYWNGNEIGFVNMPRYKCPKCDAIYLDGDIAMITQEITKVLSSIGVTSGSIDISNNYMEVIEKLNNIHKGDNM